MEQHIYCENPMAIEVAQAEPEKEHMLKALLVKYQEIAKLKDTGEMLQKK